MMEKNFFHLIDIALLNSFIIYKKAELKKGLTQKQVRLDIVRRIFKIYDNCFILEKNISCEEMHYPIRTNKIKTCKNCSDTKYYKTPKTPISFCISISCKVYLFINCFSKYF